MIEAIDVHKSFDAGEETVEALRGVTFRLPSESCTFIVGPSGSGKSTLLYLIGALDRPTSGTIRVEDWDITAMTEPEQDAYRRDRVGFVYQSFNLIGNLSAVGNVLLPFVSAYKDVFGFAVVIAIMAWRPTGLIREKISERV